MPSRAASDAGLPQRGDVIAGKYQVEDILGKGGMGVVVSARHLAMRQRVAVKLLLPSAMDRPDAGERFLREAQAASSIQSEHVARVLDVGMLESGLPYIVMEYMSGTDLSRLLRSRRRLSVVEAVDFILQAGEAIAEAHMLGIIHRDLKPGNIFVTSRPDGSPFIKVLDFGLSKMAAPEGPDEMVLTQADTVIGSPPYMSPEQLRSLRNVDTRTDIWSLGVILYLLLAGRRPFVGESLAEICISIGADVPEPLTALRPDVPPALDQVIRRCLEKDIDERVQSVAELAQGLVQFGSPDARVSLERIVRVSRGTASTPTAPAAPLPPEAFLEANTIPTPGPMMPQSTPAPDEAATASAQVSASVEARAPARRSAAIPVMAAGGALVLILIVTFASIRRQHAPASDAATEGTTSAAAASLPLPPADLPPPSAEPVREPEVQVASATPPVAPAATSSASVAKVPKSAPAAGVKPRGPASSPRGKPSSGDPLERWK